MRGRGGPRFETVADLPERYRDQAAAALGKGRDRVPSQATGRKQTDRRASVYRPCSHAACRDLCSSPHDYVIELPGRALTTNRFVSALFIRDSAVRAARTAEVGRTYREWKQAAYAVAVQQRIPTLRWATVEVQALYARSLPDAGGLTVIGKAMVDGLVDAGVFPDDDGDHLLAEVYPAPRRHRDGDHVRCTVRCWSSPSVAAWRAAAVEVD